MSGARRFFFVLPLTLPVILMFSHSLGHPYVIPLIVFVLIPLLDQILGDYGVNPSEIECKALQSSGFFSALLYGFIPLQLLLLLWASQAATTLDWLGIFILAWSVGIVTGGIGITVAHELGHRRTKLARFASCVLLTCVAYMHFFVEHNKGHHGRVATPDDPASARRGESLYAFLPRTLLGGFSSAMRIELNRLRSMGIGVLSYRNLMLWCVLGPIAVVSGLFLWFGVEAVILFLIQSATAVLLLETVNYIEHYGLQRQRADDGSYSKVTEAHSWNSNRFLSNALLFNLQRHSHHHVNVTRHYQSLQWFQNSPQLPGGYPGLILTAWIPALWRKRIHPLLDGV